MSEQNMIRKIIWDSANVGVGFQDRTQLEWALAFPNKEHRTRALMRLFRLDRVVDVWARTL